MTPQPPTQPHTPAGHPVAVLQSHRQARIVVLASGEGTNLGALLDAHNDPDYGARIVAVITDTPHAGALTRAHHAGIACATVNPSGFDTRSQWNRALASTAQVFHADYIVTAGFMRLLGPGFLQHFPQRIINTHPALLPSFPGAHGVRDALAYGVTLTGCTVHLIDEGVDTGPIIAQAAVPVLPNDSEETLHERIKTVERALLVEWVGRIARGGVTVTGRTVHVGTSAAS